MRDIPGRQWLLLRGLARESAHWGEFVPQLQAAFPQHRIATLDLPGTGQLAEQETPSRIEAIAYEVRQSARSLGLLEQPVILLGLSLGGMVVWQWLKQYPNDAERGVLINSSFSHLAPFYRRLRWQTYGDFVSLLGKRDDYAFESAVLRLVSNQLQQQLQSTAEQWSKIRRQRPMSAGNILRQLCAAAAYRPDQSRPERPVLLLNSAGDRLVSPQCSQAIARQYQLPLHTHPSAGHDLPLDDPEWLIQQLQQWI